MAFGFKRLWNGIWLQPQASTSPSIKGDLRYNSSTDKVELYNGAVDPLVNEAKAATLTNKTINGASNTLTVRAASDITGQLPSANGGTGQNTSASTGYPSISSGTWSVSSASTTINAILPTQTGNSGKFLTTNGTVSSWGTFTSLTAPKITTYTSSSGTHTLTGSPLYIRIKMVGGGSGGGGSSTTVALDGGNSGAGGNTTWSVHSGSAILTANGGQATSTSYIGATGGTVTLNSPATGTAIQGSYGSTPGQNSTVNTFEPGGDGGASPFGGRGPGGRATTAGTAGITNSGSGGGGGGSPSAGIGGGGGAAGGYIDAIIASPSASYDYVVGSGGTAGAAGTSGANGAAGGSGYIEITEYYQ